ncbi:uncharacterized protein LOC118607759 [Rousettus aegyptiacus]|uniref:Uncharacterized protein n=1 Tax=Rousettus aegyptiacus TaxID=9407 RepID=A0A7J8EKP5_ROUAE|nr:uncharacterized protein LOC118607759 [Rousettus aegyptiacus]KAF6435845.1 hypothetical protein HJG63_012568 [Rousettus aegyptiacus]
MGNFFSEQTENWEETSPGSYGPENLSVEDEINLGEETKVNIVETTITMDEPSPSMGESKEICGQTNNEENDKVQNLVKSVQSALRQNTKKPKKGGRRPTILVFYYRKMKKQNQHLPEHKEDTLQNTGDEKNAL